MKAWIMSDMHVVHAEIEIPQADVCLCAGDVSGFLQFGIDFLTRRIAPSMPVVMVLGNHDYFGTTIDGALAVAQEDVDGSNIFVLENESFEIDGVRIIGSTLWTDFAVPWGINEELPVAERIETAIQFCRSYMLDFREIYGSRPYRVQPFELVTGRELITRHIESKAFISAELRKPWGGKTVVLTHHAPSPRSLLQEFNGQPSNAAFASDLTDLIQRGRPNIWIHGHIHQFHDYVEGDTRVICNPLGYRRERGQNGYRLGFVIDI